VSNLDAPLYRRADAPARSAASNLIDQLNSQQATEASAEMMIFAE
jgi:hypothetical protein